VNGGFGCSRPKPPRHCIKINEPKSANGNVAAYAQHLRASGHGYAVATARTLDGAYEYDWNYVLKVPNVRTFLWGPGLTLGKEVNFTTIEAVDADYIVLNAGSIAESTILAVGHKCGTYEVTFVHDLPIKYVITCNKEPLSKLKIKDPASLTPMEKPELTKYTRAHQSWLEI